MSLIYEYAALHQGNVEIESVLNVGSKFIFTFPMEKSLLKNYEVIETRGTENQEDEFDDLENHLNEETLSKELEEKTF